MLRMPQVKRFVRNRGKGGKALSHAVRSEPRVAHCPAYREANTCFCSSLACYARAILRKHFVRACALGSLDEAESYAALLIVGDAYISNGVSRYDHCGIIVALKLKSRLIIECRVHCLGELLRSHINVEGKWGSGVTDAESDFQCNSSRVYMLDVSAFKSTQVCPVEVFASAAFITGGIVMHCALGYGVETPLG